MERYLATGIISLGQRAFTGDIVQLKAEPDNAVDKNAIAIYKDGVAIGYLANKSSTVRPGTKSASNFIRMVNDKQTAEVYARLMDENILKKGENEFQTFVVSMYFVMSHTVAAVTPYTYRLAGGNTVAPGANDLRERLRKSDSGEETIQIMQESAGHTSIRAIDSTGRVCGIVPENVPRDEDETEYRKKLGKLRQAVATGPIEGKISFLNADRDKLMVSIVFTNGEKDLFGSIDGVVRRCVEQVDEIREKISFMQDAHIPNALIAEILNSYRRYDDENEARIPCPMFPFFSTSVEGMQVLNRALTYHVRGKHIRLVGEKGCGKNTLIETVCWLMRRPLYRIGGSSDMDKTDLLGSKTIEDGTMGYELSDFLRTLEAGGDVDLDEANTIKPDIEVLIHSLTDDTRSIEIPGYGKVVMDKTAAFWMTMNEDYVGTGDMNDATLDRFVTIRMKAEDNISAFLKERVPNAPDAAIAFCQKIYTDVKKSINSGTLTSTCISIRGMIDALHCCDLLPIGMALMDTLASKPQDPDERRALELIIQNQSA